MKVAEAMGPMTIYEDIGSEEGWLRRIVGDGRRARGAWLSPAGGGRGFKRI
jgi:hypothetical protein